MIQASSMGINKKETAIRGEKSYVKIGSVGVALGDLDCSLGHKNPDSEAYCRVCGAKLFPDRISPTVKCPQCSREFAPADSVSCLCDADTPSLVCPFCERCAHEIRS